MMFIYISIPRERQTDKCIQKVRASRREGQWEGRQGSAALEHRCSHSSSEEKPCRDPGNPRAQRSVSHFLEVTRDGSENMEKKQPASLLSPQSDVTKKEVFPSSQEQHQTLLDLGGGETHLL